MHGDGRLRKGALLLIPVLLVLGGWATSPSRGQGFPDIALSDGDLSVSRMDPVQGEPFALYARVRNAGQDAGNAAVRFYVGDLPADWTSLGERNVSVAAGGTAVASVTIVLPAGTYQLSAQALNVTPEDPNPGNQFGSLVIEVFQSRQGAMFSVPTLLLEGANATVLSGEATVVSLNVTARGGRVLGASLEVLEASGLLVSPAASPIDVEQDQRVQIGIRVVGPDLAPELNRSERAFLVRAIAANARGNAVTVGLSVIADPPGSRRDSTPWVPATVIGSIIVISLGIAAAIASVETWRHRVFLMLLPLYSRLRKEAVLDQYTRGKIHGYLLANPGDYFTSIARALDVPGGTLAYHLGVLEREGEIVSRQDGVHKRFYPAGARIDDTLADGLSPVQRSVCRVIQETPGIKQKDIASFLGLSAATVSYHLRRLLARGLVRGVRRGMAVRYFPQQELLKDVHRQGNGRSA